MITSDARARTRRGRVLVDIAVALVLVAGDLVVAPWVTGDPAPSRLEAVLIALTLATIPLRNLWPVPALALTTAGAASVLLVDGAEVLAALAPLFALYTVAIRGDRRSTVLAWASTAGALALAGVLGTPSDQLVEEVLPVLPWTAAVAAVGDGLRTRRAYLAALEERAERAERSREGEALRRVAEERVRIARELHDVVAHHIAVVSVQAGVAQHLLTTQPEAAADSLATVRRSAATILEELGDILSVLREPGEQSGSSAPAPGLARLDALVESFAAAGLAVEWSLHGQPQDLAPTVDLVAYRVLEEGLTNALKHGTGTARLSIDYGPSVLTLRVLNSTPFAAPTGSRAEQRTDGSASANGTGHGLVGMKERTTAVGGAFRAGPSSDGTFRVEADLPLRSSVQS